MNKGELIKHVAKDCDMSKAAAEQILGSILTTITEAVAASDKVTLIGFGTFSATERSAREGRNPRTGETMQIAAKKVSNSRLEKNLRMQ